MRITLRAPRATILTAVAAIIVAVAAFALSHSPAARAQSADQSRVPSQVGDMQWRYFTMPESGVSLRVPLAVFEALPVDETAQGRLFLSRDGRAQLLLGAFENGDGRSVPAHRKHVIATNYADANIDYAPLRRKWFVLSGTMDNRTFYQRVTFSCGRRLINSWAMIYPTEQKRFYDRLVERMHRSFEAGQGPNGNCRLKFPAG